MPPANEQLAERLAALEVALETERLDRSRLSSAIEKEVLDRQEALLWQEHRLVSAARNLYQFRKDPDLRWAAAGGLLSAFLGRSAATAAAGGGLLALVVTASLTLQANYLLSLQTDRMDVQTIVMDAQRRTQNFQAEFSAISGEIKNELAPLREKQEKARQKLKESIVPQSKELASALKDLIFIKSESDRGPVDVFLYRLFIALQGLEESESYFSEWYSQGNGVDVLENALRSVPRDVPDELKKRISAFRRQLHNARLEYSDNLPDDIKRRTFSAGYSDDEFFQLELPTRLRIAGLSQVTRASPIVDFDTRPRREVAPGIWSYLLAYFADPSWGARGSLIRLSEQKTSPERAQLLAFLMAQRVWLPGIFAAGGDFSESDLSLRTLGPLEFGNAKFEGANFTGTIFDRVSFEGDFRSANFSCARFYGGSLQRANLVSARFSGASFDSELRMEISSSVFAKAHLNEANLENALLSVPWQAYETSSKLKVEEVVPLGEVLAELEPERKNDLINRYSKFEVEKVGRGPWKIRDRSGKSDTPLACQGMDLILPRGMSPLK
ncbi:pentapeptide repeat-containing protein [Bradyrhizobium sp. DN5]|uniref:pentapeptide repeat-containing protein n=1 Tax=Bradyrhizobium sp. DN5 TaxID=3056950 RepID=UPI00352639CA